MAAHREAVSYFIGERLYLRGFRASAEVWRFSF